MNELELLERLRHQVPHGEVSSRAADMFSAGLAAAQTGQAPARRRGGRSRTLGDLALPWRLAIAAGVAAALAAGVVTAIGRPAATQRPQAITVDYVVRRAVAAAARQPAVPASRWVYRKVLSVQPYPPRRYYYTYWARADNRRRAFYVRGRLVAGPWWHWGKVQGCARLVVRHNVGHCQRTRVFYVKDRLTFPFVSYLGLGSLPANPRALVRFLADRNPRAQAMYWPEYQPIVYQIGRPCQPARRSCYTSYNPAAPFAFRAFNVIAYLLSVYALPPELTQELYRALGDIPGIEVSPNVTDVAGRAGIGFLLRNSKHPPFAEAIILNPRTFRLMAIGGRMQGTAVLRQALVPGPGTLPKR
jgi:hypothetical protein